MNFIVNDSNYSIQITNIVLNYLINPTWEYFKVQDIDLVVDISLIINYNNNFNFALVDFSNFKLK
jgi:hypothetical protein